MSEAVMQSGCSRSGAKLRCFFLKAGAMLHGAAPQGHAGGQPAAAPPQTTARHLDFWRTTKKRGNRQDNGAEPCGHPAAGP